MNFNPERAYFLLIRFTGKTCLSPVHISGPTVVDLDQYKEPLISLACRASHNSSEYNQLDVRWYYGQERQIFHLPTFAIFLTPLS